MSMKLTPSPFAKSKRPTSSVKDSELIALAKRESIQQISNKKPTVVSNEDLLDSYIKKLTLVLDEKTNLEAKIKEQNEELENIKKNPKKFIKNFTCDKCDLHMMEIEDILVKFANMRKKLEKEININNKDQSSKNKSSATKKNHAKYLNVNTKFKDLYFMRITQLEFEASCMNNKSKDYKDLGSLKIYSENFEVLENTKNGLGNLFILI